MVANLIELPPMYLMECHPRVIFQKDPIEIAYLDKFSTLHLSWSGNLTSGELKFALAQMLRFATQYKVLNWLIDARESERKEILKPEWAIPFLKEDLPKCGIRKMARLASEDFFYETRISDQLQEYKKQVELCFEMRFYQDVNSALEWFCQDS